MFGWDFGAVLTMATLLDADTRFLAEILPAIEPLIVIAWKREDAT